MSDEFKTTIQSIREAQEEIYGDHDHGVSSLSFSMELPTEVKKLLSIYFGRGQVQAWLRDVVCNSIPQMIDDLQSEYPEMSAELKIIMDGLEKWIPLYRYIGPEPGEHKEKRRAKEFAELQKSLSNHAAAGDAQ